MNRVLMILGGLHHDFAGFEASITPVLESGDFVVERTYDLDALQTLDSGRHDLVLSYTSLSTHREGQNDSNQETLTPAQTSALAAWVRSGGALLAVHSATVSGKPTPEMASLFGGKFVAHPPQFSFPVYPLAHEHPITNGIDTFAVHDEFYIQDYSSHVDIHMVALDRGVSHPMVWTRQEAGGRVAYIAMGHSEAVWILPPFQKLLQQAAAWLVRRPGAAKKKACN